MRSELCRAAPLHLGKVAFDKNGALVGKNDMASQAEQALLNIQRILTAYGARWTMP